MSAFDDAGLPNVLAPLTHSLIRRIPPPPQPIMPGMDNPATRLQTAAQMGQRGRTPMPQAGPGNKGPMARDLYKTLMLKQAGIGEDQREYHELARDPSVTADMLEKLLKNYTPPAPEQHGPGSIQITKGKGPNAMSDAAMGQWMQRAAHAVPGTEGETLDEVTQPIPEHGQFNYKSGKVEAAQQPVGFRVGNIAPPQQAQPQVSLAQRKEQLAEQKAAQSAQRAEQHTQRSEQATEFSQNARVLDELQKQEKSLLDREPGLARGHARDAGALKDWNTLQQQIGNVRQRLQGAVTPQQQLPQPPQQGHPLDPQSAQHFLQAAGGDKNKARELAKQAGWSF